MTAAGKARGEAILSAHGLRDETLFKFKLDQEIHIVEQLKQQLRQGKPVTGFDAAKADILARAQAGYAHYYPGLKQAAYRTYVGLCQSALSVDRLYT